MGGNIMKFKKLTAVLSSILLMSTIFVGCSQPTATTEAPA
ncbi:MAG: hypothetical protein K0S30_1844, partial [Clostridia bacterium]|nr:hypothetical protein [Clostridia bacterium]